MIPEEVKIDCREKFDKGDTEQALQILMAASLSLDYSLKIQAINSDFIRNKNLHTKGLISDADFRVITNKVNYSLVRLLNATDENGLNDDPGKQKGKRKVITTIGLLIIGLPFLLFLSMHYFGEPGNNSPNIHFPPVFPISDNLTEDTFEEKSKYFEEKIRLALDKSGHVRGGSEILSAKIDTYKIENKTVYTEGRFDAKNFLITYQGNFICEIQVDGNHLLESLEFNNPVDRQWTPVGNKILEEVNSD